MHLDNNQITDRIYIQQLAQEHGKVTTIHLLYWGMMDVYTKVTQVEKNKLDCTGFSLSSPNMMMPNLWDTTAYT